MTALGLSSVTIAWIALLTAGLFEIGWPVGLKLSQNPGQLASGIALAVVCIFISGFLLWYSQQTISIGTAYAVWGGIGAAGTFIVGVMFFGDAVTLFRVLGVTLIIGGVISLKLGSVS
ncbi:multidrug efflux SMR transporter [Gymnodinialimonas sp. 2305UL16-5]|uniref:DMT family transporter n=1 Tax=Gymnodinialimonas mytili TaxID=3126503 RepID=UPI0030AD9ECA